MCGHIYISMSGRHVDEWSDFFEATCVYNHMWFCAVMCVTIHVEFCVCMYVIAHALGMCVRTVQMFHRFEEWFSLGFEHQSL